MEKVLKSDGRVMQYTGIPSMKLLLDILGLINTYYPTIKYWKGRSSTQEKNYEAGNRAKPGPRRSMSRIDELICTLIRLRTGWHVAELADLFDISDTRVSEIFITYM